MHIDSYQVEVQRLSDHEWEVDQCFRPVYKWQQVLHRVFWMPFWKRSRPEIIGDPHVRALIVKSDAERRARQVLRQRYPRNVRIVRIECEGAHCTKFVVWQNGKWLEK